MKLIHDHCGGEILESETIPPYISEEHGTVPAYECLICGEEILGDIQIVFVPENEMDEIQIESIHREN